MAWNYRKRIKIAPGVHLNFSKGGASTSVGPKGAKINIGKNGTYLHMGVPGTGLYSRQKMSGKNNSKTEYLMTESIENEAFFKPQNTWGCVFRWLGLIAIILFVVNLVQLITGNFDKSEDNYNMLIGNGIIVAIFIIVYFKRFTTFLKRIFGDKINSENNSESASLIDDTTQKDKNTSNVITREILGNLTKNTETSDPLFEEVARFVVSSQIGSTNSVQRKFSISFHRADKLMVQLERKGIVGPPNGTKPKKVLVTDLETLELILFCK